MTDTISFGPGPVARQVVAADDGDTLIINQGPATVFFCGNNSIRATDASGIVPVTANSYFGVNGKSDLYACVASGQIANLQIISGGLNFFLPLTSLTIPYGASGSRVVINPPDDPGAIVGYDNAGNVTFVLDSTGLLVGPNTGPQVQIAGGNPAYVAFPLNDPAFAIQPSIYSNVIGSGVARFGQVVWNSAILPAGAHDDWVDVALNSPRADGTSSANGELDWFDGNGAAHAWQYWDQGGIGIRTCQQLTAADPSITPSSTVPAQPESWRDMRPLQNSFVGTIAGYLPPQYRKTADGTIQIAGFVQLPGAAGNYNNVAIKTLPAAYRPPNLGGAGRPQWCATDAPAAGTTPVKFIVKETGDVVLVGMNASLSGTIVGIFGEYALSNTGQILS